MDDDKNQSPAQRAPAADPSANGGEGDARETPPPQPRSADAAENAATATKPQSGPIGRKSSSSEARR